MAGLSVLLETQKDFPKHSTQIISKTSLYRSSSLSCSSSASPTASSSSSLLACPFLEYCYYCRKRLLEGNDIYMYRGDRAFCSEECRCRQIFIDEESGRRDNCSLAAAAAAEAAAARGGSPEARVGRRRAAGAGGGGGKGRAVAGGFAY